MVYSFSLFVSSKTRCHAEFQYIESCLFFQISLRKGNSKPPTMPFRIVACTFPDNLSRNSCIRNNENVTSTSFLGGNFCLEYPSRRSEKVNCYFPNYRLSFRKLQILISQTADSHFANYRFSFRKLQIYISQTKDFHFATDFHFVSFHFVSFRSISFRKLQ